MSTAPNPANLTVGRGKAYFGRFNDDGSFPKTFLELGNIRSIRTTPEITKIERESTRSKASVTYAEAVIRQIARITLELDEQSAENIAMMMMGDVSQFTQSNTPVTGEQLASGTDAAAGRVYFTQMRDISSVSIDSGVTPLVAGTDYVILDDHAGAIEILAAAPNFSPGQPLTIDYTAAAITGLDQVRIATKGNVKGQLRFIGDPIVGQKLEIVWWNVSFTPNGDLDLITDDFGIVSLQGTCLDDSVGQYGGSAAEPIGRILYRTDT